MAVSITFHGHATFSLKSGDKDILIDPYLNDNPASTTTDADVNPTTIILTHAHNDHVGDTVAIAKRTGAPVVAPVELAFWLQSQGVEQVIPGNHGGTRVFDGGTTKFTPAWHSSSYSTDDGRQVAIGVPCGHVVRFGGQTIYVAGDTALFSDMKLIGEEGIDIAILPIGDGFTMGPKDAARAAEFVGAKIVIPCHYNTTPQMTQDDAAFKADVEGRMDATVVIMKPGETKDFGN